MPLPPAKIPELREVRAGFLGRAIHSSHEAWQKQVEAILSKPDYNKPARIELDHLFCAHPLPACLYDVNRNENLLHAGMVKHFYDYPPVYN